MSFCPQQRRRCRKKCHHSYSALQYCITFALDCQYFNRLNPHSNKENLQFSNCPFILKPDCLIMRRKATPHSTQSIRTTVLSFRLTSLYTNDFQKSIVKITKFLKNFFREHNKVNRIDFSSIRFAFLRSILGSLRSKKLFRYQRNEQNDNFVYSTNPSSSICKACSLPVESR